MTFRLFEFNMPAALKLICQTYLSIDQAVILEFDFVIQP